MSVTVGPRLRATVQSPLLGVLCSVHHSPVPFLPSALLPLPCFSWVSPLPRSSLCVSGSLSVPSPLFLLFLFYQAGVGHLRVMSSHLAVPSPPPPSLSLLLHLPPTTAIISLSRLQDSLGLSPVAPRLSRLKHAMGDAPLTSVLGAQLGPCLSLLVPWSPPWGTLSADKMGNLLPPPKDGNF